MRWESVITSVYGAVVGRRARAAARLRGDPGAARRGAEPLRRPRPEHRRHPRDGLRARGARRGDPGAPRDEGRHPPRHRYRLTRWRPAADPGPMTTFLTERHLATLTTMRADGSPHVVPVGLQLRRRGRRGAG